MVKTVQLLCEAVQHLYHICPTQSSLSKDWSWWPVYTFFYLVAKVISNGLQSGEKGGYSVLATNLDFDSSRKKLLLLHGTVV